MSLPAWGAPILEGLRARAETLPHALLVHGPRGVGKLALAEELARMVLCEAAEPALRPCGRCEGCRWLAAGSHPDFRRVEPEALAPRIEADPDAEPATAPAKKAKPSQEIKIDQVRELAGFLGLGSHRGRRRIALVHPAERMNANAANALLKGLEEPPGGAMFILVSHRAASLLPTVRSRCVSVPVALPDRSSALAWLRAEGLRSPERWLDYAGGAPMLARDYNEHAARLEEVLAGVAGNSEKLPATREDLEAFAEALQKLALDRAFAAFGLPPRFGTPPPSQRPNRARWLAFARQMGTHRALAQHPLHASLFAAQMLGERPEN